MIKQKFVVGLCSSYSLFMVVIMIYYYLQADSFKALVAVAGIVCGLIPLLLRIRFNKPLIISYLLFLFASQYLGSIRGWYSLGYWDTILHFLSGVLLAFVGIALYEHFISQAVAVLISPLFSFLFIFAFATLGGVIWEIYEFSADELFHLTLQGGGNRDTMIDLIADAAGGFFIGLVYSIVRRSR
ncbi:hypothetical protein [Bacillus kwashiorkori]|uniref:hypothetical protein n=1 Tax=Bacillus kwashiorkori TaxID=1522318 RepID=UPI000781C038|nr:hypothetical protein [Bacillus kwashiorkori]